MAAGNSGGSSDVLLIADARVVELPRSITVA
jgi:hypothetical protein